MGLDHRTLRSCGCFFCGGLGISLAMPEGRRPEAVGVMLATIASVITIVGGVFDYGPRTARDAHSWVDSWARASGAHTWALWIMIVAACAGLILMMHTTWLGEHVEERVQLITSTGLL